MNEIPSRPHSILLPIAKVVLKAVGYFSGIILAITATKAMAKRNSLPETGRRSVGAILWTVSFPEICHSIAPLQGALVEAGGITIVLAPLRGARHHHQF